MYHNDHMEGRTFSELAEEIGNLRYDALEVFLDELARKMHRDAQADLNRGRTQLSHALVQTGSHLEEARLAVREAWRISKPFMDGNESTKGKG